MAEPFLGEIRIMSFDFPPQGWARCDGQFLPINQNQALFALFGTVYGGNGQTTFALPDLRGRVPLDDGAGFVIGENGGARTDTLAIDQVPTHTHPMFASSSVGDTNVNVGHVFAVSPSQLYDAGNLTTLHPSSVSSVGGSQPHQNMQPYLVLSFCVALQGIFPSRN